MGFPVKHYLLTVWGDGRTYKLNLRSDKQAGPFRLLVKSIAAIEATAATAIGVVMPGGINRLGDALVDE